MNKTLQPKSLVLTRRDFLKTTAIVGGSVAGALPVARFAHAAGGDTLKLALIGCGGRGSGAAAQALTADRGLKLVAMADAFEERLTKSLENLQAQMKDQPDRIDVPKERQFVGFDAHQKAIAAADVVILATPPGFRPIHFEAAVQAGKNIFMEKPVAVDAPGVRRVLAANEIAKQKNLKVGVGLQRHHDPGYVETVKRIQDGAIGDIVMLRAYWNGAGVWCRTRAELEKKLGRKPTEMEYQMYNWYYFVWLSGDHICEQHIHNLDVGCWVKGKYPVRAQGMGGRQVRTGLDHGEIFDHHFVEYEFDDGSRMMSQCRHIPGCWSSVSEHAHGTKGIAEISGKTIRGATEWKFQPPKSSADENAPAKVKKKGGRKSKSSADNPTQIEHDHLFAAIRANKPYNEADYGAKSSLVAILGRMCTYSGKQITWEEAMNSKLDLMPKTFAWDAEPPVKPDAEGRYPIAVPGKSVAL
ncbi:MAG: twin-arginine translocation signal domain-containing protein [Verrucomicrobia bacterium]|nr:twin-arginine translocation signal domain-containing protein [Verrucomicrobiota bacterium]